MQAETSRIFHAGIAAGQPDGAASYAPARPIFISSLKTKLTPAFF
jgi:hypothetical protein